MPHSSANTDNQPHLIDRLNREVSGSSLAFVRILLGAILMVEVFRFIRNNWIYEIILAPKMHFTFFGFEWVRPMSALWMYLLFGVLGFLAVLITLGKWSRPASLLFASGFAYTQLIEKAHYLNHAYLIFLVCLLFALLPAECRYSIQAKDASSNRKPLVPVWTVWAVRVQVGIPYLFGALAKINGDWLQGQPMQMWMSRMGWIRDWVPAYGDYWLALLFSYGGFLIDVLVVPTLLWPRTRAWAFGAAVAFHVTNSLMFRIGVFPWLMIALTTIYLPYDWPERVIERLKAFEFGAHRRYQEKSKGGRGDIRMPKNPLDGVSFKPQLAFIVLFFTMQCLLPFRHLLYPGRVDWTEEGALFSWRMMLNDKSSAVRVALFDPVTGKSLDVNPRPILTPKQLERLSQDPDNLREFAVELKRMAALRGFGKLEVRVLSLCSLNGRKPQLLVDPKIDLGNESRSWGAARYIVPLTEPLLREPWLVPQNEWERHVDGARGFPAFRDPSDQ